MLLKLPPHSFREPGESWARLLDPGQARAEFPTRWLLFQPGPPWVLSPWGTSMALAVPSLVGATGGQSEGRARVASPIRRILGGPFAAQATVATIEGKAGHRFFSCGQPDHFPEIQQMPTRLQQTWKEIW